MTKTVIIIPARYGSSRYKGKPLVNPKDIDKIIKIKKKFPKYVICGYGKIHKYQNPSHINLPKVVVNSNHELIYISRSLIPGSKKITKYKKYYKQICIYAFNKSELSNYVIKNNYFI